MPATIAGSHEGLDTHANRPAANAAGQPVGALYSCSTHSLIYKTDGSSWATWATLGTAGAYVAGGTDVAVADGGTGASTASGARTNLGLVLGTDVASLTAGVVPIAQLATGTPNGSKFIRDDGVLAVPAGGGGGGSDLAQTYSGGGSVYIPGTTIGDPHKMPASPNASDDEFHTVTGTVLGTLDTDNITDAKSWWHVERVIATDVNGRYWTIPSLPCTIEMGFRVVLPTGNHASIGLMLLDSTPTAIRNFELNAAGGSYNFSLRRWTNRTTFASSIDVAIGAPTPAATVPFEFYIRLLVTSSSSVTASYSHDGYFWTSPATLAAISPTLTPGFFGIQMSDPLGAATIKAFVDYVRVT